MTNDQQDPKLDSSVSVCQALRRSVEFKPLALVKQLAELPPQNQFDTIGPPVKQLAELLPQIQFDTIRAVSLVQACHRLVVH